MIFSGGTYKHSDTPYYYECNRNPDFTVLRDGNDHAESIIDYCLKQREKMLNKP